MQVWTELQALGAHVRQEPLFTDAFAVACETMQRVRRNIDMLVPRLQTIGYHFGIWEDGQKTEGYVAPTIAPSPITAEGISLFERELGTLPLSLHAFSGIAGSVDFRGHHPQWSAIYGPLDPLVVFVPFAEMEIRAGLA